VTDDLNDRIQLLIMFKDHLQNWDKTRSPIDREWLNQNVHRVEREVIESGCHKRVTIYPPPAVGGLAMLNTDPFNYLFERPYLMSMTPTICDMLDQTIGVLRNPLPKLEPTEAKIKVEITRGYAFVAMPMDKNNHALVDVLEAIKAGASECGIIAERIDDDERSERITDRVLESIRKAEFVIVDLTLERPNVFWEAGYAHGIGKIPIYIARDGTDIHFDVHDYPVIKFRNMKELREGLVRRLQSIAETRTG
jgi:hypothetical protein